MPPDRVITLPKPAPAPRVTPAPAPAPHAEQNGGPALDDGLSALDVALNTADRSRVLKGTRIYSLARRIAACQYAAAMDGAGIPPCYGVTWRELARYRGKQ